MSLKRNYSYFFDTNNLDDCGSELRNSYENSAVESSKEDEGPTIHKVFNLNLDAYKWQHIQPISTLTVRNQLKSKIKYQNKYVLSKHEWTHLLREETWNQTKIPCSLAFQSHSIKYGERITCFGQCTECNAEIKIKLQLLFGNWNVLKDTYMPIPNVAQWKNISERFSLLRSLPHCIGALDGKHIRIEKVPNSGSSNLNYKLFHSVVLIACSDAKGLFTLIECGYARRNSDGGIFRASAIKQWLQNAHNIPSPSRLPNDDKDFTYYFVGDEAFPLLRYLMRPYAKRTLDNKKRVFNYRLSRGRKTIECAFGMMSEKFASTCILQNFVRSREAYNLRDYLANYFISPHAAVPWQWNYIL
ncbi:hypothetical protein ABMA28_000346 [Loxostege sticticalis]|uniref:DDE Tnp4 domain-containing protein n=1 Tax=Loxostege sticticalis TaxID=481309 RepID=A0ABD0TRY9_LOXSC